MELFVFWLGLAIAVGVYASRKGRSGWGFFFLAVLLSPLIGFLIALAVAPNREVVEKNQISSSDLRKCPYCAELVKSEAIVCKHCGRDLPPQETFRIEPEANQLYPRSETYRICPKCETRNLANHEYCGNCSTKLE